MNPKSGPMLTIVLVMVLAAATAAEEPDRPDLSGRWTLNQEASDNLMEVLGPMAAGRGGQGDGVGSANPEAITEDQIAQMQRRLDRMLGRLSYLEIFHEDPDLDYTDGMDITRLLHTDGREDTVWTDQGQMKAKAVWNDAILDITWRGEHGDRKTYLTLSADGRQLIVNEQLVLPDGGNGATIRLVYDRAKVETE